MFRSLAAFLAVAASLWQCGPARAAPPQPALERIAQSGVLTAATRDDAPPFAFRDKDGKLAGFSVDLIEQVRKALAAKLERPVQTQFVIVSSQTRVSTIEEHKADLGCETATMTWPREQHVDFTLPIFRDGTRILTYRDTLNGTQDMGSLHIGVVEGSVEGEILRSKLPDIALQPFPNMPAALSALEAGQVQGIANIGIVLRGLMSTAGKRQSLVIVPRGEALGYETIACMVPQNDSPWRNFVNGVFRDLLRGIDAYRGGYMEIYQRWFGRDADIPYPLDERAVQFFLATQDWLD